MPHPIEDQGKARDKAAEMTGANRQYVSDAKKILENLISAIGRCRHHQC